MKNITRLLSVLALGLGLAVTTRAQSTLQYQWQATSGLTPLATATATQVQPAQPAANIGATRNYVTSFSFVNTSATVSTTVTILDGVTVIWTGFLPAQTAALQAVPVVVALNTPLKGSPTTALNIQLGTTGASVYWNVGGFWGY
jgi:hypothetical protein